MPGILSSIINTKELLKRNSSFPILDDHMLKELHIALLEMLIDINNVCSKYDINMFLTGGSLLGCVRHKGFIPWDDDIDISMSREDYNRFTQIFEKELSNKYILNAPNYKGEAKARFPIILKKGTYMEKLLDDKNKELCKLSIDIFIVENIPENPLTRWIHGLTVEILEAISSMVYFVENADNEAKTLYKRVSMVNYLIRIIGGHLFSIKPSEWWFNQIDKLCNYPKDSSLVGFPTGSKHYFGEILEKEKVYPLCYRDFEGEQFLIFSGYDYYLTHLYGDYRQVPPILKRQSHYFKKCVLDTTSVTFHSTHRQ